MHSGKGVLTLFIMSLNESLHMLIRHPYSLLLVRASAIIPKRYFSREHVGIGLLAQLLAETKVVCLGQR